MTICGAGLKSGFPFSVFRFPFSVGCAPRTINAVAAGFCLRKLKLAATVK
jgi:hypothetical protein